MQHARHFLGSVILLAACALTTASAQGADDRNASPEKERELIAILASDAPGAEKAISCKLLAIHGSSAAVPELLKLLENEQLASWSRIALEAIPGPEADAALRHATSAVSGRLLVGTINSIGVRRDAGAVDLLSERLKDADADVASAAAVALGRIGNAAAAKALRSQLASSPVNVRSAVAEGLVLCAERSLLAGQQEESLALYDEVRKADVPKQRIVEATRGAILASKPTAGIALLIEQLNSKDIALFQVGLGTAREFPGNNIDKFLANELSRAVPERAALVVQAMADRKETVVLSAVVKAAAQGPKPVRLAALNALGRVGNDTCLTTLLDVGVEADAELSQAAKTAIGDLPGANVDKAIVSRLPKAQGKLYVLLIEVVGQRRIEAVADLQKALDSADDDVRAAALKSLGATVPPQSLNVLVTQVVSPKNEDDAPIAELALKTACIRMPDREACAEELAAALKKAPVPTQAVLLEILHAVGGTNALQAVGASAKSPEPELQDVSSKLLGEWMTIDAAPVLLDLAKTSTDGKYKSRAYKGYIRIARQFVMPEPQRLEMCRNALEVSRVPADQKLVLEILKRYPTLETLKLASKMNEENPDLKDDATQAMLAIAQKVKGPEVAEILGKSGLGKVKLEIIKAEYGAGATQRDVTETVKKQAADLQLLSLPQATYNESFGGDPVPNAVKQLKIQYRINGKDAQATFAENALIILPLPK